MNKISLIQSHIDQFVVAGTFLYSLNHPLIEKVIKAELKDEASIIHFGKHDGGYFKKNLIETYESAKGNSVFNSSFISVQLMASITIIHDSLKEEKHLFPSELWEFLRHLRNAAGHGNRFEIRSQNILPAKFGKLSVTPELHGYENVITDFVNTGDVLELFTTLIEHLQNGT